MPACSCSYPCSCNGPVAEAAAATAALDDALAFIGDQLRRQHLAAHDVPNPLPWKNLQDSERARWITDARAALQQKGAGA